MTWRVVLKEDGRVLAAFDPPRAKERAEEERAHLVEVHGYGADELEVTGDGEKEA